MRNFSLSNSEMSEFLNQWELKLKEDLMHLQVNDKDRISLLSRFEAISNEIGRFQEDTSTNKTLCLNLARSGVVQDTIQQPSPTTDNDLEGAKLKINMILPLGYIIKILLKESPKLVIEVEDKFFKENDKTYFEQLGEIIEKDSDSVTIMSEKDEVLLMKNHAIFQPIVNIEAEEVPAIYPTKTNKLLDSISSSYFKNHIQDAISNMDSNNDIVHYAAIAKIRRYLTECVTTKDYENVGFILNLIPNDDQKIFLLTTTGVGDNESPLVIASRLLSIDKDIRKNTSKNHDVKTLEEILKSFSTPESVGRLFLGGGEQGEGIKAFTLAITTQPSISTEIYLKIASFIGNHISNEAIDTAEITQAKTIEKIKSAVKSFNEEGENAIKKIEKETKNIGNNWIRTQELDYKSFRKEKKLLENSIEMLNELSNSDPSNHIELILGYSERITGKKAPIHPFPIPRAGFATYTLLKATESFVASIPEKKPANSSELDILSKDGILNRTLKSLLEDFETPKVSEILKSKFLLKDFKTPEVDGIIKNVAPERFSIGNDPLIVSLIKLEAKIASKTEKASYPILTAILDLFPEKSKKHLFQSKEGAQAFSYAVAGTDSKIAREMYEMILGGLSQKSQGEIKQKAIDHSISLPDHVRETLEQKIAKITRAVKSDLLLESITTKSEVEGKPKTDDIANTIKFSESDLDINPYINAVFSNADSKAKLSDTNSDEKLSDTNSDEKLSDTESKDNPNAFPKGSSIKKFHILKAPPKTK